MLWVSVGDVSASLSNGGESASLSNDGESWEHEGLIGIDAYKLSIRKHYGGLGRSVAGYSLWSLIASRTRDSKHEDLGEVSVWIEDKSNNNIVFNYGDGTIITVVR